MKRITVEKIEQAYQLTGLKPKRWMFYEPKSNCGCALTALAFSMDLTHNDITISFIQQDNRLEFDRIAEESVMDYLSHHYPERYLIGFARGFDGGYNDYEVDSLQHQGCADGQAIAQHLFS